MDAPTPRLAAQSEHQGVYTAIESLSQLTARELERVHLTVRGPGHPQYERRLHDMVAQRGLTGSASFRATIPRTELPDCLASFEVLVLPSIWSEGRAQRNRAIRHHHQGEPD
jgi:glycosyltransferase involved in cell wall biosynthesis